MHVTYFFFCITWLCLSVPCGLSQVQKTPQKVLLNDLQARYDTNEGIDSLYNFKFEAAKRRFYWLKQKHPVHPLSYFLMGLCAWWQILPNFKNTAHDRVFLAYMDTTIMLAKRMQGSAGEVEGAFFLAAAYGFLGRFHGERREWVQALWAARKALVNLEKCRNKSYMSIEILIGEALYNYYAAWLPEHYPALKPLRAFFKKGNKEQGIAQLREVAHNAFYVRTEAQYFLMRILSDEDSDKEDALRLAKHLRRVYPDNAYFHRYYTYLLYEVGSYAQCEQEALAILERIDKQQVGYGANSGRYAAFFLGWIYKELKECPQKAVPYFVRVLRFAVDAHAAEMGYTLFSLIHLGEVAESNGQYDRAKAFYKKAKSLADRDARAYKQAKQKLKALRKRRKQPPVPAPVPRDCV